MDYTIGMIRALGRPLVASLKKRGRSSKLARNCGPLNGDTETATVSCQPD
jgi:hypothetical protein